MWNICDFNRQDGGVFQSGTLNYYQMVISYRKKGHWGPPILRTHHMQIWDFHGFSAKQIGFCHLRDPQHQNRYETKLQGAGEHGEHGEWCLNLQESHLEHQIFRLPDCDP